MPVGTSFEHSAMKTSFSLSSLQQTTSAHDLIVPFKDNKLPLKEGNDNASIVTRRKCNSLTKRRIKSAAVRRSWSSTANEHREDFWSALQANYNYIMDNQLIDKCNEANSDLITDGIGAWSLKEFDAHFSELYLWLNSVQETIYGNVENILDKALRTQCVNMVKEKTSSLTLFNEQASQLMQLNPRMQEEVGWRSAHLNSKWDSIVCILGPSECEHCDQDSCLDIDHEIKCLRKWFKLIESRLKPLNFNAKYTKTELEAKALELKILHQDIENHGKIVGSVVKLCRCSDSSCSTVNIRRIANGLERRWGLLYLQSLEWQCYLETLSKRVCSRSSSSNSSTNTSTDNEDSDDYQGPNSKYPRLSTIASSSKRIENEYSNSATPMLSVSKLEGVMSEQTIADTKHERCCMQEHHTLFDQNAGDEVLPDELTTSTGQDSQFTITNRKAPNLATFYFKHEDTDTDMDRMERANAGLGLNACQHGNADELVVKQKTEELITLNLGQAATAGTIASEEDTKCAHTTVQGEPIAPFLSAAQPVMCGQSQHEVIRQLVRKAEAMVSAQSATNNCLVKRGVTKCHHRKLDKLVSLNRFSRVQRWLKMDRPDDSCDASGEDDTEEGKADNTSSNNNDDDGEDGADKNDSDNAENSRYENDGGTTVNDQEEDGEEDLDESTTTCRATHDVYSQNTSSTELHRHSDNLTLNSTPIRVQLRGHNRKHLNNRPRSVSCLSQLKHSSPGRGENGKMSANFSISESALNDLDLTCCTSKRHPPYNNEDLIFNQRFCVSTTKTSTFNYNSTASSTTIEEMCQPVGIGGSPSVVAGVLQEITSPNRRRRFKSKKKSLFKSDGIHSSHAHHHHRTNALYHGCCYAIPNTSTPQHSLLCNFNNEHEAAVNNPDGNSTLRFRYGCVNGESLNTSITTTVGNNHRGVSRRNSLTKSGSFSGCATAGLCLLSGHERYTNSDPPATTTRPYRWSYGSTSLKKYETSTTSGADSEDDANKKLPVFKLGSKTTYLNVDPGRENSTVQSTQMSGHTEEQSSSLSERAWDNYREKYLSEAYSETHDSDAARKLLEFGEDYRNYLDSQSDWSTNPDFSPTFGRRNTLVPDCTYSSNNSTLTAVPDITTSANDSSVNMDSDYEDAAHQEESNSLRKIVSNSRDQLLYARDIYMQQVALGANAYLVTNEIGELTHTCNRHIELLNKIDNSSDECAMNKIDKGIVADTLRDWRSLQEDLVKIQEYRSLQAEILHMKGILSDMQTTENNVLFNLLTVDDLPCEVEKYEKKLEALLELKKNLLSINATVHRFVVENCNYNGTSLKTDTDDLYGLWDSLYAKITDILNQLQPVLQAWRSVESRLEQLQMDLQGDEKTLHLLDTALQAGGGVFDNGDQTANYARDMAKLLSETSSLQSCSLSSRFALEGGSLSDSGISDEGSEHELGERERRLTAIRRLVRQLECVLAPDCQARIKMAERLNAAEEELRSLQKRCRSLIGPSATNATAAASDASNLQTNSNSTCVDSASSVWECLMSSTGKRDRCLDSKGETSACSQPPQHDDFDYATCSSGGDDDDPSDDDSKNISWFKRFMRASVPFQVVIITLLCVACLLEPKCCDNMNNFAMSLSPQLRYIKGPPPI